MVTMLNQITLSYIHIEKFKLVDSKKPLQSNRISVLIPVYNAELYIKETIQSIVNQTYKNFEILIADDSSLDNSRSIIDSIKDPRIRTFHNHKNIGKPRTCNKLFEQVTGEFVTIHDADDISLPLRFEKLVSFLKEHPQIAMCGHIIQRISEKGKLLPLFRDKATSHEKIIEKMKTTNTSGDPSIMFKTQIVSKIGGLLRPYFKNNMDYDLALRILEKYEVANLPEVLSYYRNVPTSISKNIKSHKKLITQKMTQYFAKERAKRGIDSLMEENWDKIKTLEEEFAIPYKIDKSLYLRECAAQFMYFQMYGTAIRYSWRAVRSEPFRLINLRTLQYCLRKSILPNVI